MPSILAVGVWFMDESPRWLLIKGRHEEARASLQRLREGKFTEEEIDAEFEEQKAMIVRDAEQGHLREVFKGSKSKNPTLLKKVSLY